MKDARRGVLLLLVNTYLIIIKNVENQDSDYVLSTVLTSPFAVCSFTPLQR